jgi:hypothetical protein
MVRCEHCFSASVLDLCELVIPLLLCILCTVLLLKELYTLRRRIYKMFLNDFLICRNTCHAQIIYYIVVPSIGSEYALLRSSPSHVIYTF